MKQHPLALLVLLALASALAPTAPARAEAPDPATPAAWPLIRVDPAAPLTLGQAARASDLRRGADRGPSALSGRVQRVAREWRAAQDDASRAAVLTRHGAQVRDGALRVRIQLRDATGWAVGQQRHLGGVPLRVEQRLGTSIRAWVAPDDLPALARDARVRGVTLPPPAWSHEVVSKGVAKTHADDLHALGIRGAGVTVGVLDGGFAGYEKLLGVELPPQVITKGFGIGISGGGEGHGTAVAELVHDMAPDALLVLVAYGDTFDFEVAVDWLVQNKVDLITTSTGSSLTGPCDGRDAMALAADAAVAAGTSFLASAGNYGDSHHLGTFTASDRAGFEDFHAFAPNRPVAYFGMGDGCFQLPVGSPISVALTWDDWGDDVDDLRPRDDLDLWLMRYDEDEGWQATGIASDYNQRQGGYPWEVLQLELPSSGCYGVAVRRVQAERDHELHLYSYQVGLARPFVDPARSVIAPCVGRDVLCVAATSTYDSLAMYSSQGPANPDETTGVALPKPDVAAPAGTKTVTYGSFSGTSAAAPHAAGALALLLELTGHDQQAARAMLRELAVDLGDPGWDVGYGWGRVDLAPCTPASCDDHLPCTQALCDPTQGCQVTYVGPGCWIDGACVDEGATPPGDPCRVCDPASPLGWTPAPDGTPCEDGLPCTANDTCQAGACVGAQQGPCVARSLGCWQAMCDDDTGLCTDQALPEGSACGEPVRCDAGIWWPQARCDGAGACLAAPALPCAPYAGCADALACADSCVDDAGCAPRHRCDTGACVPDLAPVADAGPPVVVAAGSVANLDGSASRDPEGSPLTWTWRQTWGEAVALDDPAGPTPRFQAPAPLVNQTLRFQLVVHDGSQPSAPATTTVVVQAPPNGVPLADAGPDQEALEGTRAHLDGQASTDPEGGKLSFRWQQRSGPALALIDADTATPSFVAPEVAVDSLASFDLIVSDGLHESAPDTVVVRIVDQGAPPLEVSEDVQAPDTGDDAWEADAPEAPGGGSGGCAWREPVGPGPAPPLWLALLLLLPAARATRRPVQRPR